MASCILPLLALASATLAQIPSNSSWQSYVVGSQSSTVYPLSVLPTSGNVTNPTGLLTNSTAPTILTRNSSMNAPPEIVLDFGLNTVGFLQINFAGATANTLGLRLAFSETQQYLTNVSDFTRSDNGDTITPGSD